MLSGLIVYSMNDKEKNTWFIESCVRHLSKRGVSLVYQNEDTVLDYVENHHVDFVIYRSRDYHLVEQLESKGIRCFNNSQTNRIANNKFLTYQFMNSHKIGCLFSFLSIDELSDYPIVMKSVDGHGGQEVYLLNKKSDAEVYQKLNKTYVYQPFYHNDGDLRVYVLNKKVVGAVMRNSKSDFRSNYSLGGTIESYNPDESLIQIAEKIASILDADYIGIDFLKVDNKWLVNEIEDPVGARMLYQTSGIDIIDLLCDFIFASFRDVQDVPNY